MFVPTISSRSNNLPSDSFSPFLFSLCSVSVAVYAFSPIPVFSACADFSFASFIHGACHLALYICFTLDLSSFLVFPLFV